MVLKPLPIMPKVNKNANRDIEAKFFEGSASFKIEDVLSPYGSYNPTETFDFGKMTRVLQLPEYNLTLSDEQYGAVKNILKWLYENPNSRTPFRRLAGFAGTGKTAVISYFLNTAQETFPSYMKEKNIAVCTFTWKAALVLQKRGVEATSIHSLFYELEDPSAMMPIFVRRSANDVRNAYSLIVVDEASMVDSKMRKDIESFGIPVLYVGDSGQLPAISNDPDDKDFMVKAEDRLTEIHRQALDSPIIRLSLDIREGKPIPFGQYGPGVFKASADEITDKMMKYVDQIICGKNETRKNVNTHMRKVHGYDVKKMPYMGEKLIGLSNVQMYMVFNGQQWTSGEDYSNLAQSESHRHFIRLRGDNGEERLIKAILPRDNMYTKYKDEPHIVGGFTKEENIYQMDFGYCITCHKSQGSSYDKLMVYEERLGDQAFHRRWLYTACTRAVSKLLIVKG